MTSEIDSGLSSSELRSKLFKSLKEKGVLQSVKAQLRNRLAQELQGNISSKSNKERSQQDSSSIFLQVANSVVANHLQSCSYDYTLSVFVSEGLGSSDKIISLKDILQMLHIHSESKLHDKLNKVSSLNGSGFLWCLLQHLSESFNNGSKDISVQTNYIETKFQESLDQKLLDVERLQHKLAQHHCKEEAESLEAKVFMFQRKYDMQKRAELEAEIERFRSSELAMMRIEEREKCNKEISNARIEFEQAYSKKLKDLNRELEEIKQKSEHQQQVLDKESFEHRQKILTELQALNERELGFKKSQEIAHRNLETYEKELKLKEDQLQFKEETARQHKEQFEMQLKDEMKRLKLQMIEDEIEKKKKIEQQELELREEKIQFAAQKEMYMKWKEEANVLKVQNEKLNMQLLGSTQAASSLHEQLFQLQKDFSKVENYKLLKAENVNLKKNAANLQEKYEKSVEQNLKNEQEHQKLVNDLLGKISRAEEQIKVLGEQQHEKDNTYQKKYSTLQNKCEILSLKCDELNRLYEDSLISQRELLRVVEELRSALFQANQEKVRFMKSFNQKSVPFSQQSNDMLFVRTMENDHTTKMFVSPNEDTLVETQQIDSSVLTLKKLEQEALELENNYKQFLERQKNYKNKPPSRVHFNSCAQYQTAHSMQSTQHSHNWVGATNPGDSFTSYRFEPSTTASMKVSSYSNPVHSHPFSSTQAVNGKEAPSFGMSGLLNTGDKLNITPISVSYEKGEILHPLVSCTRNELPSVTSYSLTLKSPPQMNIESLTQYSLSETRNFKTLTQYPLADSDLRASFPGDLTFIQPVTNRLDTLAEQSINIEVGEVEKSYQASQNNTQEEVYLNKQSAKHEYFLQETSIATFDSPNIKTKKNGDDTFSTTVAPQPVFESKWDDNLVNEVSVSSKNSSVQELRASDLLSENVASEDKQKKTTESNVMAEYMEMLLQKCEVEPTKDEIVSDKTQPGWKEKSDNLLSEHEEHSLLKDSSADDRSTKSISSGSFKW